MVFRYFNFFELLSVQWYFNIFVKVSSYDASQEGLLLPIGADDEWRCSYSFQVSYTGFRLTPWRFQYFFSKNWSLRLPDRQKYHWRRHINNTDAVRSSWSWQAGTVAILKCPEGSGCLTWDNLINETPKVFQYLAGHCWNMFVLCQSAPSSLISDQETTLVCPGDSQKRRAPFWRHVLWRMTMSRRLSSTNKLIYFDI